MANCKKIKKYQGLSLIETLFAMSVAAIFIYQTYSFMNFLFSKASGFNKSLELVETYEEVKRILSDTEVCSQNFSSQSMSNSFDVNNIYAIDNLGVLTPNQKIFSTPSNIKIIFNMDEKKLSNMGAHLYDASIDFIGQNRVLKLPIFILEDYGKIKDCSSLRLLEENTDSQIVACNTRNRGEARFFESAGEVMYCGMSGWVSTEKTAGTYITMLTKGTPCRHKNMYTNACSCPYGFTAEPVLTFANYNCANGVLDTWTDLSGKEQPVEDSRCGIRMFLCRK